MRRFNFNKPLVESPYPPKSTNVLWVDVNESTGKVANIKKFLRGEWVDYLVFVPESGIPEPVVGPADNEIWYTTTDGEVIPNWTYYDPETTGYPGAQIGEIISNSYENGIGKITCKNAITIIVGKPVIMQSHFSDNLCSIILPNSVTSIGENAFSRCSSLTSIVIPNSVTSIGDNAFSRCSSLTSIILPNSVMSIGYEAFYGCYFAKDHFINNSSLDAEENNYWSATVYDCKKDGVFVRDNVAIKGDRDATSMVIPYGVTSIGYQAFDGCCYLSSITIPNSVTSIGDNAFFSCSGLTSITIPNSVTSIGDYAFSNCSFTSITLPNSVTSIGDNAFEYCSNLESITIPNSLTNIGDRAFSLCGILSSITFEGTVEQWNTITKGDYWNEEVPATHVQCSDGQVTL